MKSTVTIVLYLFLSLGCMAQGYFSLAAWNVENLFDTIPDTGKDDAEFLPDGNHRWTRYRLWKKLREMGKTVVAIDSVQPVDVIGLCEVENDSVMTWLTERTALRSLGYRYVMTSSRDERGIDVALMYAPMRFHMLCHECIRTETGGELGLRDVLYAAGTTPDGDTLDVYVVHLPSKLGGMAAERNRRAVIARLLEHTDSVCLLRREANIIVMGDFNDELHGRRMQPFSQRGFYDVVEGRQPGTYKYRGTWSTLDHILIKTTTLQWDGDICHIPFLLEPDKTNGGQKPFRTYLGPHYHGGISDHLPVWLRLKVRGK